MEILLVMVADAGTSYSSPGFLTTLPHVHNSEYSEYSEYSQYSQYSQYSEYLQLRKHFQRIIYILLCRDILTYPAPSDCW